MREAITQQREKRLASSYFQLAPKIGYIETKHTHKEELETLYFNFAWLLQNRFLLSISRKLKTIEVSAFHAPLVSSINYAREVTSPPLHTN